MKTIELMQFDGFFIVACFQKAVNFGNKAMDIWGILVIFVADI